MTETAQLEALADLHRLFEREGIQYWLFGGWAVDFHARVITRPHADLDIAIWLADYSRISEALASRGWTHAPEDREDGSTGYERGSVRLELAFLEQDEDRTVYTPLRDGRASWAGRPFQSDVAELRGVRASVISLESLRAEKSQPHDDEAAAAKDRADLATLSDL